MSRKGILMKKNSFANNNQSATATYNPLENQQAKTPTTLELIKMAAELAAIDHAADTALYSPIPISGNFQISIGDVNISCSINNDAAREKQPIQQQKPQETQTTTQQQKPQETQTTQQQPQQQTTTHQYDMFRQLPEKYHKLYGVVTDYLGSYTKVKISITPNVMRDAVKIAFINKGVSTAATNYPYPFFGVESIKDQKYFEKYFKAFGVYPNGDAFYITVSIDEEMYLNRFMQMIRDNIRNNKREVIWGRYN
jgi:hypothetical protein